jgi:hypothetical protein
MANNLERRLEMRTNIFVSILLVLTFVLATGATTSSPASEGVTLLDVRFIIGKGLLVMLKVSDDVDLDQAASLNVNGVTYPLDCKVAETVGHSSILRCIADVSQASIGGEATILFGSASFNTTIKDPRPWCYSIFDYGGTGPSSGLPWGPVGSNCQIHTARPGDTIQAFNPNYPTVPYWTYMFDLSDTGAQCGPSSPDFGEGYYYDC